MKRTLKIFLSWLALVSAMLAIVFAMGMKPSFAEDYKTGPYAGALIGWDVAKSSGGVQFLQTDLAQQGAVGTALLGYTWTMQRFVVGVEADFSLEDVKGSLGVGGLTITASNDWMATVRARVGMPIGPVLPYVSAGLAFARPQVSAIGMTTGGLETGFAGGGGIDFQVSNTIAARMEALYVAFPNKDYTLAGSVPFTVDRSETIVRTGILIKLN